MPETQSLVQPPPQQQAGTAGKAGRAATAPPRSKAAALADEKAEMDKAWQSFVSIKGNTLPPMEGSSAGGSTAATATTASALAGAAAQQSAPQPLKEGSHDLANKAMEEYDASARHHALKDPHRQYLQAVQTLRDNAATLNRNARPPARLGGGGAGSGNLDDGGGMSNSGGRVAGVLGGGGARGGARSAHSAGANLPHDGDATYQPHAKHFGYQTPLDFVDSFDPYMGAAAAIGGRGGAQDASATPSGESMKAGAAAAAVAAAAPPMAALPEKGAFANTMAPGSGPAPKARGSAVPGSKGAASDLATQILETTPNFQYTKIRVDGTDPASGGFASGAGSAAAAAAPDTSSQPVEGPFGAGASMVMKPLPSVGGGAAGGLGGMAGGGAGLQTPAPPLPTIPGHAGMAESAADEAMQAFARQSSQLGAGGSGVPAAAAVGAVRRRRRRRRRLRRR